MNLSPINYTFYIDTDEALEKCQTVEELENFIGNKFSQELTSLSSLLHKELASMLDFTDCEELFQKVLLKQLNRPLTNPSHL